MAQAVVAFKDTIRERAVGLAFRPDIRIVFLAVSGVKPHTALYTAVLKNLVNGDSSVGVRVRQLVTGFESVAVLPVGSRAFVFGSHVHSIEISSTLGMFVVLFGLSGSVAQSAQTQPRSVRKPFGVYDASQSEQVSSLIATRPMAPTHLYLWVLAPHLPLKLRRQSILRVSFGGLTPGFKVVQCLTFIILRIVCEIMAKAKGQLTVEPHEPTSGVVIHRETPELVYEDEQKVIIPSEDVDRVLHQIAVEADKRVLPSDTADALDNLLETACD